MSDVTRDEEVFGFECRHHYGITIHEIVPGEPVAQTVYRLIREVWHAPKGSPYDVLDNNHTWEINEAEKPDWFSSITLRKNERSPYFASLGNIRALFDGPGAIWFSQEYRLVTREMIEREIEDLLQWADRWQADAECQRDTIRGRKARQKYLSFAASKRRESELVRKRWPQFNQVHKMENEIVEKLHGNHLGAHLIEVENLPPPITPA